MSANPLKSLSNYSHFMAELLTQPNVKSSTVVVWSDSPYTGVAEGEVIFTNGLRLRVREEVDFDAGIIISYGYEVYRGEERLYWYDVFRIPMTQLWLQRYLITSIFSRTSNITVYLYPT